MQKLTNGNFSADFRLWNFSATGESFLSARGAGGSTGAALFSAADAATKEHRRPIAGAHARSALAR